MSLERIKDNKLHDAVTRCRRLARRLGGDIEVVDPLSVLLDRNYRRSDHRVSPCPFSQNLSIGWGSKTVWVSTEVAAEDISGIIHEMGHVFASKRRPSISVEWEFFGWEYCVAVKLGLLHQWDKGTADYQTKLEGDHVGWGRCSPVEKDQMLRDRVDAAIANKLVSRYMTPLSVR